jgi:trk system potassium uptake protein
VSERRRGSHPTRLVVAGFLVAILVGTALLSLPMAHDDGVGAGVVDALFASTSSVTVTGLASIDVSEWSAFGEVVLLALVQVGGFGIMTIGAILVVFASQRIGLRQRMTTQTEIGAVTPGDIRRLVRTIAIATLTIEATIAAVLTLRFWAAYDDSFGRAAWAGVFHAVTSFNNAGIGLRSDNLVAFAGDPLVLVVLGISIILGGLGFPVILEVLRQRRASKWTLHTKIVLAMTGTLLVVGPLTITWFEWTNPATLGPMGVVDKLVNGWFQGVSPRTAGFNSISIGDMRADSLLITISLMFIGSGPASTGGGIKVTTFAVIGLAVWSEMRGDEDATVFRRRLPAVTVRQALSVIVLSIGAIFVATQALLLLDPVDLMSAVFETTSAFGTVGLSTGITPTLSSASLIVLSIVMLAGRVGPTTFAAAVVVREHRRLYRYPEERPIIG